ncbi:hypothetical protein ACXN5S_14085 [Pseudoroseicyclus sp. H15]
MPKSLIMGFATNQEPAALEVFLKSARRVYAPDECDIALITNSVSGIEGILAETGAKAINTPSVYSNRQSRLAKVYNRLFLQSLRALSRAGLLAGAPEITAGYHQLLETWHHPHFARWFAYKRVMQTFPAYDRILLADTKDVLFQAPVFGEVGPGRVTLFEDGESFAPEGWNARWVIDAYGQKTFETMANRQPICIGVLAGETAALRGFLDELCAAIARHPFGRIEQAIFNKMYFGGEFQTEFTVVRNAEGAVLTMAGEGLDGLMEEREGEIRDKRSGALYPVVHMYDRQEPIRAAARARYAGGLQ